MFPDAKSKSGRHPDGLPIDGFGGWNRADPENFGNLLGLEFLLTVAHAVAVGQQCPGDWCIRACDLMLDDRHRSAVEISIE